MNLKLKATLLGGLGSLCGVALWILFSYFNVIAGIAGALMGYIFLRVYKKNNPTDNTNYPYFIGALIIVIDIIIAELIVLYIAAIQNGVLFTEALAIADVQRAIIYDLVVGLLLSGLVFGSIIYSEKKNERSPKNVITAKIEQNDLNEEEKKND